MKTFGLKVSELHFKLLIRQQQIGDLLAERVTLDKLETDYTNTSLSLRNNPWFFCKKYAIEPLVNDEDFYLLIETKVGLSKFVRQTLK